MNNIKRIVIGGILLILASVAFGQANPVLQLDGTDGGLVLNRLTNLQRNAIENPTSGLIIYNVNTGCLNYYSEGKWFASCGVEIESCALDVDCPSGKVCIDGVCVDDLSNMPCSDGDRPCADGFVCSNGFCVPIPE